MIKPYKLFTSEYKAFYDCFRLIAHTNELHPYILEFTHIKLNDRDRTQKLSLTQPIYLSQWPIKAGVPQQSVDVMVDANFQFRQGDMVHTRSSVYLTYFWRNKKKNIAEPFENLRFDFHPEVDDTAHPLLHAHIFSSQRPDSEPKPLEKINYTINWEALKKPLTALRIPIPNMTLPSVLCCLVACHLGPDKLRELLKKSKDRRKSFPDLAISEEQRDLFSQNSFAGSQWFERP